MRKACFVIMILATVSSLSALSADGWSATIGPDPAVNKPHTRIDGEPPQSTLPLQPMNVTQPPPEGRDGLEYFYPYQRELALAVGGYWQPNSPAGSYSLLGIDYLTNSLTLFHWQLGIEGITLDEGHVWVAARWNQEASTRLRTYYSVGAGARVIPENGLATFLQIGDYFPRLAAGVEYGLQDHSSVRGEVAVASDFQGNFFATVTAAYVWGF